MINALNASQKRWFFIGFLCVYGALQLWMLQGLSLFGDEAFYWLEGQYLAWSYAELPGWTAWMIRLGTELFGNQYWAVRFFSYLAFIGVFYAVWLINKSIIHKDFSTSVLLLLGMPLLTVVAVMALPDVWMVFFVMWVTYLTINAYEKKRIKDWFLLGIFLACSINVHVRMWIWITIAGLTFVLIFYRQLHQFKGLFTITLPLALLGGIPVLIFNYYNDFALFEFQFGQRHPWYFQWQNVNFLLSQLLVIGPIILFIWIAVVVNRKKACHPMVNWIIMTALIHWLFYVITSLFADGLRTSVHWVLVSYVPVLVIAVAVIDKHKIILWGVFTGCFTSVMLMLVIMGQRFYSPISDRIIDNSSGWKELSLAVESFQKTHNINKILTDYFMTGAELKFELNADNELRVLPHEKNNKHGRETQLKIMGLLSNDMHNSRDEALLVVEDSALKLQKKGKYYQYLCESFASLKHLKTISIKRAKKQFHLFLINSLDKNDVGLCQIPPLFYVEPSLIDNGYEITGWVVLDKIGIKSLSLVSEKQELKILTHDLKNTGIAQQFPEIKDPNAPNNGFRVFLSREQIEAPFFRLEAVDNDGKKYLSQIYYLP